LRPCAALVQNAPKRVRRDGRPSCSDHGAVPQTCDLIWPTDPGAAALRIDSPEAGANPLAVLTGIAVKPDTRYRLTGWMRSDTPGVQGRFYAEWANASGWHSFVLPWTEPSAEWRQFSVEVDTAHNPEGRLYIVVQAMDKGRVWFDDLALAEVK